MANATKIWAKTAQNLGSLIEAAKNATTAQQAVDAYVIIEGYAKALEDARKRLMEFFPEEGRYCGESHELLVSVNQRRTFDQQAAKALLEAAGLEVPMKVGTSRRFKVVR